MATIVEIGFNLNDPTGDFATLDDPVKGILGSPIYVLAGFTYYDVTDRVKEVSISRGKSRQLDRYPAGQASVTFENNDRRFDPLYSSSPFAGQIVPRRDVRIRTNDIVQYKGVIDDWNLNYAPEGNSIASLAASDGFAVIANQVLSAATATSELSGARIEAILNLPSVNFPAADRDIEVGTQDLQADVIEEGTNALSYLQLVADSEAGAVFINKLGGFSFTDRSSNIDVTNAVTLSDTGSGIPYQSLEVVYGSELLYNQVTVSRLNGGTATVDDTSSQITYGISVLTLENLLLDTDAQNTELATHLIANYAQPEYRFERLGVNITALPEAQQNQILNLEMGDLVRVIFTPNNVPPAIEQFAEVIRIEHSITPSSHIVNLGFSSAEIGYFTLSDARFGRLTRGNILL
jgi:hypothetical protein